MVIFSGKPWRRWRLVFAIALLFCSLGISGCQQLSASEHSEHVSHRAHVLEFVPKQSLLATVLDTTVKPGKTLQSTLSEALPQAADLLLAPLAIDLNENIRPWLGDQVAFAITDKDLDRDRRTGRQVGYLVVADTTDGDRLREFLEVFWQRQAIAGAQPDLLQVSGVPIIAGVVAGEGRPLATAVVGGSTLLIANDVRVLRQSLRAAQAPTLQLSDHDCCGAGWVHLRIPNFIDWLGLATPPDMRLESGPQWQELSAKVVIHPKRVAIDTQLTPRSGISVPDTVNPLGQKAADNRPGKYLPASVAWAAMGHDLRPLWHRVWNELGRYRRLPAALSQQWLSTQLAQALSEPLLQLLAGDYAVGQLDDGTWLMAVLEPTSAIVNQLDDIAEQQGLTVSRLTLEGQAVTAWSRLKTRMGKDTRNRETTVETDIVGLHTTVGDCDVFATSITGLTAALAAPEQPLPDTEQFQRTVQAMDRPNQGYVYGTWTELERLLESNRWFSLLRPVLQPWSQSIDAIAITSYGQTVNQPTGSISILLKN
ncbi:MAG: DUF3352 domain-containing protein [Cyanobacteria bacterium P01_H01_bin.26]